MLVFIEVNDDKEYPVHKIPKECLCGCKSFNNLFTFDAQFKNLEKGRIRQFANESHRNRYLKHINISF